MDIKPVSGSGVKFQEEVKSKVKVESAAVEQPKTEEIPQEEKEVTGKIDVTA